MPDLQSLWQVIDLRSFSNIWFWLVLAVAWSSASHFVLGVPYDLIARARRDEGAARDVETLAQIGAARLARIGARGGAVLLGTGSAVLTTLGLLGFLYGIEFAQALFLLALPFAVVAGLRISAARHIRTETGEALRRRLLGLRLATQGLGVAAIFVTALWGMWHNLTANLATF